MKLNLLIKYSVVIILLTTSQASLAERTIKGTITTTSDNIPVPGARVRAWDNDFLSRDDRIDESATNSNGYYEIHHEGGHYDPAPFGSTAW